MRKHLKDWGAVYIILALFLGSWVGQALAMRDDGPEKFWAATFENWQSEFLQLAFQAVVLLGLRHVLFKADAEDGSGSRESWIRSSGCWIRRIKTGPTALERGFGSWRAPI
jgi:hypothetical protein